MDTPVNRMVIAASNLQARPGFQLPQAQTRMLLTPIAVCAANEQAGSVSRRWFPLDESVRYRTPVIVALGSQLRVSLAPWATPQGQQTSLATRTVVARTNTSGRHE
jgi:hypothetical protein